MLLEAAEVFLSAGISNQTVTASVQLIGSNVQRSGLNISNIGAANSLYLLLGAGTASASNAHIVVPVGGSWDGMIGVSVWRGAVQAFSTTTPVGLVEL
jgi:hypothetical protein